MLLRIFRNFFVCLFLAAVFAAAVVIFRSSDPFYTAHELLSLSRFRQYDPLITNIARKHSVDPMLVKAIVWRESSFHPDKVGKDGERGLMQVTEGAARDWVRANKIENFVPTDLFAPKTNIEVGTWYLAQALGRYPAKDDPITFALAEYNAGRRRVTQWVETTNMGENATASDLRGAMSIPSTRRYIESILDRYHFYRQRGRM